MKLRVVLLGCVLLGAASLWGQGTHLPDCDATAFSSTPAYPSTEGVMIGSPVTGEPYSALETSIHDRVDGSERGLVNQQRVYRDSKGRVREEFPGGPGRGIGLILISDPVARMGYKIYPPNKLVKVTRWPDASSKNPVYVRPAYGSIDREQLPSRMIDGVSVAGCLGARVIPAHGVFPERHVVVERWYSPELGIDLESRDTTPDGTSISVLSDFQRGEPDPALFRVPADYKVVEEEAQ
jgi:hypothetical protein